MESPRRTTIDHFKDALPKGGLDGALRTGFILTTALSAACLSLESQSQVSAVQQINQESQNCHDVTIEDGSTVDRALSDHAASHPQIDKWHNMEAFFDYATSRGQVTSTALPKTVLSICLTPDNKRITSITDTDAART